MKFGLFMRQAGGGCDYMVGCGCEFVEFEAKDMKDAIRKVTADPDEEESLSYHGFSLDGERTLSEAFIFKVEDTVDVKTPFENGLNKLHEAEEKAEQARKESDERTQYEKLKRKFG
jgi:hypothetical protein